MRLIHLILITLLVANFPVHANAANNADSKIVQELKRKASQGDADAQFQLGEFYLSRNTARAHGEAISSYQKAAAQEHAGALSRLGYLYLNGHIVTADEQRAFEYLQRADKQGDAAAAYQLGFSIMNGGFRNQVTQDRDARGIRWIHESAEKGYGPAQFTLGEAFMQGIEVDVDPEQARNWFDKALNNGVFEAGKPLGEMYAQGDGISQDIDKAIDAYTRTLETARAGRRGSRTIALLSFRLAELLELATPPQTAAATLRYKEAVEHGIESITNLANIRLARLAIADGDVERIEAAHARVFDAALAGLLPSMCLVIETLEKGGPGLYHDPILARQWSEKLDKELIARQGFCLENCSIDDDRKQVCDMTHPSSTPIFE